MLPPQACQKTMIQPTSEQGIRIPAPCDTTETDASKQTLQTAKAGTKDRRYLHVGSKSFCIRNSPFSEGLVPSKQRRSMNTLEPSPRAKGKSWLQNTGPKASEGGLDAVGF